ncbi:hypothetical protein [Nocardioides sp. HB32]
MFRFQRRVAIGASFALGTALLLLIPVQGAQVAAASDPSESTIGAPPGDSTKPVTQKATWTGSFAATGVLDPSVCAEGVTCDSETLHLTVPKDFWKTHSGSLEATIAWDDASADLDLYVYDSQGALVAQSASSGGTSEKATLGQLAPGDYTVTAVSFAAVPGTTYDGSVTMTSQQLVKSMTLPEDKSSLMHDLTVKYPLRVVFVGRTPTKEQVAELKKWIPSQYQPTVANVAGAPSPDGVLSTASGLLNWNRGAFAPGQDPYFLGTRFTYDVHVYSATKAYSKALFARAKKHTADAQTFKDPTMTAQLVKYDQSFGKYRVVDGVEHQVTDPSTVDMVDGYAVEDWMWRSRTQARWKCAFIDVESKKCASARILQDTPGYHDPFYDKHGLDLDKMPEGVNKGSTYLFLDTFTPSYAGDYFRQDAYHTWTTDKVIKGQIVQKPVADGGSWRITDPDTNGWAGVDFARTWGGRYRWHFFDLGAAPNNYESAAWLGKGVDAMSSDYPMGDPPIWQYENDPEWQQNPCPASVPEYLGDPTPCTMMPRLGRDVAYGLFFRSTAGYLYRPIPQGDVYWLATTNFTDFYSRPQWVGGAPVSGDYGNWWTDPSKLYKIDSVKARTHDDTLRWLSSAMPYVRWVGRKGEVVPLYDPKTGRKTGTLDTSPKYADLPAPEYHVRQSGADVDLVPEPLYGGKHVIKHNSDGSTIDLTEFQNQIEKAKASGLLGASYDDSVNTDIIRDYIDAHRKGMADIEPGLGTVPSLNMVFEKAYTWALPAIVGGIALAGADGNAWGVFNNVNDRFKACSANYPVYDPSTDQDGDKVSLLPCTPTQETGTGFSYTIEHEAAHNLGLSHPHDGSYGVERCPEGDPNAGKWACYWAGLGWVMDVSAAPTTYAMDYRPYEVEDQDQLQRGHVAEYLLAGQEALNRLLASESADGRTTPDAKFHRRYDRYRQFKAVAVSLFRRGDYLHAEYAARNAALAARGVPQTRSNTVSPKLVQAGQIYYWKVDPQSTAGLTYGRRDG